LAEADLLEDAQAMIGPIDRGEDLPVHATGDNGEFTVLVDAFGNRA
jgi:hypothetical protein